MPFIHTRVNCPISKEKEATLSKAFGEAITLVPGKSESWLMLQFEENCRLWFRGEGDEKMAFIKVQVFGAGTDASYNALTGRMCALLEEHLGIPQDHIYVSYEENGHWGWNGANF